MKVPHLVLHDYGMGAVWALVWAHAASDIIAKWPHVVVHAERPAYMDDATYALVRSTNAYEIDEPPFGWLDKLPAA